MSSLQTRSRTTGFSLIELMIAMVVGLIVLGAVLTFTVSMIRAYSENIRSTRLTQDLRTGMNVIVRDLRRAGFDSMSVTRVLTDSSPSTFNTLTVSGNCVAYQYDRGVGGPGGVPEGTELRGVRLNSNTGTMEMSAGSVGASCAGAGTWVPVTDPTVVQITQFIPRERKATFCSSLGETKDAAGVSTYNFASGEVRYLTLCLKGRLVADNSIARHVTSTTRIRAEDVQFYGTVDPDYVCPAPAPADLLGPGDLNKIAELYNCVEPT